MNGILKDNADGITRLSTDFFNRYKHCFGDVVSAQMSIVDGVSKILVLVNNNDEEMHLGGVNAGYGGEGPKGAYNILKACGFLIEYDYIMAHKEFELNK